MAMLDKLNEIDEGHADWMRDVPRLTLPTKGIDQWPTQVQLNAVYAPPPYFIIGSLTIDQQATLIIPVLRPGRTTPGAEGQTSSENYAALIKKLVKSSGIYALASLVSPLISLVLAPFLTHNLSRNDYGALTVLNTAIALMAGITQFGLASAFFRAYNCDYESKRDRSAILSTVVILLLLSTVPVTVAAIISASSVSGLLLGSTSYRNSVIFAAIAILMQNLTVPGFSWMRAESRPVLYSILSVINLLVSLGGNIFFVGILHMGIAGSLLATAAGYACISLCTLPTILIQAGLHVRRDITRNLLSFGFPLVFNFISVWVLQLSDRFLLSRFSSLSQVASYGVAYTLGGVLSVLVISPFVLAWPTAMYPIAKRKDAARVFQLVFRWFSIVLMFAAYGLSLVSNVLLALFFPPAYHSTAFVIPIIAASIMFYGVYNVLLVGVSIKRKTWFAVSFTTLAALINVGANLVLIPLYGSMGAAASTLIAYALLAVVGYIVNQRIYPVPFEIGKFMIALSSGIVLYVGACIFAQAHTAFVSWAISLGGLITYGGCLLLLVIFPKKRNSFMYKRRNSIS